MIVVLADELRNPNSINAKELQSMREAARIFGCRVYPLPFDLSGYDSVDDVFAYVPQFEQPTLGIWIGVIPTYARYQAIYESAIKKNIYLANTPEQHQIAMEFVRFYPLLQGVTPKSIIVESIDEIASAMKALDFPVFVKGSVKSNKDDGWSAVVAHNMDALNTIVQTLFSREHRSRGRVIIRELAELKQIALDPNGFPIGREYRAFVYNGGVLAYGFYWDEYDDSAELSGTEKKAFITLLQDVAKRVDVPFLSVDIGQLVDGRWIVIEIGDGQFSGLSSIPVLELWSKIKDLTL